MQLLRQPLGFAVYQLQRLYSKIHVTRLFTFIGKDVFNSLCAFSLKVEQSTKKHQVRISPVVVYDYEIQFLEGRTRLQCIP
jgi:hypothetical protein